MAAINNLFSIAQALAVSAQTFKSQIEINNSFRPGQTNELIVSVADFISGIHGKEMFISKPPKKNGSTPISSWNYRTVKGDTVQSNYFANRSSRTQLGSIVSTNNNEWIELQGTIYGIYKMIDPLSIILQKTLPKSEQYYWLENMGIILSDKVLVAADGTILITPNVNNSYDFAEQWNTIKVPYDKKRGYDTPYVFGVETELVLTKFPLRIIGDIIVNQKEAINYWNSAYLRVVSR